MQVRKVRGNAFYLPFTNGTVGQNDVTVFELYRNAELSARIALPWHVDFERREFLFGPWDCTRNFNQIDARDVDETPATYRRNENFDPRRRSINLHWYDAIFFDELRVWSRGLQEQELDSVSRVPMSGNETDLLLYYSFDEGNPYNETNKAIRYSGLLSGTHVTDDKFATGTENFGLSTTYPYNPEIVPFNGGVATRHWPTRGAFTTVPESLFPVFEKSFVTGRHATKDSRTPPFRVLQKGYGPAPNAFKPPQGTPFYALIQAGFAVVFIPFYVLALVKHAMVAIGNVVYVFGGSAGNNALDEVYPGPGQFRPFNTFWLYNVTSQEWLPPINVSTVMARYEEDFVHHSMVAVGTTIFVLGTADSAVTVGVLDTLSKTFDLYQKAEWLGQGTVSFGRTQQCAYIEPKICILSLGLTNSHLPPIMHP
jgi:hypothetical protein